MMMEDVCQTWLISEGGTVWRSAGSLAYWGLRDELWDLTWRGWDCGLDRLRGDDLERRARIIHWPVFLGMALATFL
jgi:hypothetical protein